MTRATVVRGKRASGFPDRRMSDIERGTQTLGRSRVPFLDKEVLPNQISDLVLWMRADRLAGVSGARMFDGVNQEFNGADSTVHQFGNADFTIAFHCRFTAVSTTQGIVAKWSATEAEFRIIYSNTSGKFEFSVSDDGTSVTTTLQHPLVPAANRWYYFVAKHEQGVGLRLKIDEVEATEAHTTGLNTGTELFALGSFSNSNFFNGRLSKVKLWDRLTTDDEDTSLYNYRNGKSRGAMSAAEAVDLRSSYNLAEPSGNALDSEGSNPLTAVNAPTAEAGPEVLIAAEIVNSGRFNLVGFSNAELVTAWSSDVPTQIGSGYSLHLDGTDDHVVNIDAVTDDLNFDTDSEITLSIWFKPDISKRVYIFSLPHVSGSLNGIDIEAKIDNTFEFHIVTYGGDGSPTGGTVTPGSWHHLALTYDGATVEGYVNGTSVGSSSVTLGAGLKHGSGEINIGRFGSFGQYVDGRVDDARIYNVGLSSDNVTWLATGGSSGTDPGTANLVGHFPFDIGPISQKPVNGDFVCCWESMQTNRRVFAQGTSSLRPTYSTNAISTQQALTFDGTDDLLRLVEDYLTTTSGVVFIVLKSTSNAARDIAFSAVNDAFDDEFLDIGQIASGGFGYEFNTNAGTSKPIEATTAATTNATILTVSSDGSDIDIYVNGAAEAEIAPNGNTGDWFADVPTTTTLCIGGKDDATPSNHYPGNIAEILIYNRDLTASEYQQIHNYLSNRYSIALA